MNNNGYIIIFRVRALTSAYFNMCLIITLKILSIQKQSHFLLLNLKLVINLD